MRLFLKTLLFIVPLTILGAMMVYDKKTPPSQSAFNSLLPDPLRAERMGTKPAVKADKLKAKATEALTYCKNKKFNSDFCILIDMSLHSGVKRFFVWDFNNDTVSYSFLVGHGCCDNPWSDDESKEQATFSNKDGSHCSALGKYKLGERAYSDWGIHVKYLMHGLESSNNNALARTIVFHSWDMVSDEEVYPDGTAEGWGCPTISNNSLRTIDPILKSSQKPVLMWIYN